MKNELIIKTRHMVSNEKLMSHKEHAPRFLRYVTLDKIMNEIKENGMELYKSSDYENKWISTIKTDWEIIQRNCRI